MFTDFLAECRAHQLEAGIPISQLVKARKTVAPGYEKVIKTPQPVAVTA